MTTAFVLSGGASLGAVEVGMLAALAEAGVVPDLLLGTSVGAVNAAFVAGHPIDETFVKRRRQEHTVDDEHTFGQEPIEVLRARNGGVEPGRPRR